MDRNKIINIFLNLTKCVVPNGFEDYIIDKLLGYVPYMEKDGFGNLFCKVGQSKSLFTCHLDTVGKTFQEITHVIDDKYIKSDGTTILGGDNKAGVTILLNMIEHNIPGTYYFFLGEEVGCLGSKWLLENKPYFLKQFNKAIAFDRREKGSIITYQRGTKSASSEFANSLSKEFEKCNLVFKEDENGFVTDTAVFTSIIPECTNISAGVYGEHTNQERLDIEYFISICESTLKIDWDNLVIHRNPNIIEHKNKKTKKVKPVNSTNTNTNYNSKWLKPVNSTNTNTNYNNKWPKNKDKWVSTHPYHEDIEEFEDDDDNSSYHNDMNDKYLLNVYNFLFNKRKKRLNLHLTNYTKSQIIEYKKNFLGLKEAMEFFGYYTKAEYKIIDSTCSPQTLLFYESKKFDLNSKKIYIKINRGGNYIVCRDFKFLQVSYFNSYKELRAGIWDIINEKKDEKKERISLIKINSVLNSIHKSFYPFIEKGQYYIKTLQNNSSSNFNLDNFVKEAGGDIESMVKFLNLHIITRTNNHLWIFYYKVFLSLYHDKKIFNLVVEFNSKIKEYESITDEKTLISFFNRRDVIYSRSNEWKKLLDVFIIENKKKLNDDQKSNYLIKDESFNPGNIDALTIDKIKRLGNKLFNVTWNDIKSLEWANATKDYYAPTMELNFFINMLISNMNYINCKDDIKSLVDMVSDELVEL